MQTNSNQILNVLEQDGWCKHEFSRNGRHCLMGAAISTGADTNSIYAVLDDEFTGSAAHFNDHKKTKFKDVRKLLLAAASLELSNPE